MAMTVVPYRNEQAGKKQQVAKMFDHISPRYDLLNHLLSLGIDRGWRKKAISLLKPDKPQVILDVATGTGDFAIQALSLQPQEIIGLDISEGMLGKGREKIKRLKKDHIIRMITGDSENLPFPENKFDAITVAFGVRNFEDLQRGLSEMYRVLKPGGTVVILEFSKPSGWFFRQLYNFYFKLILPNIGSLLSRDKAAYAYLPASVEQFPYGNAFLHILESIGFKNTKCKTLTFGISSIYLAKK